MVFATVGVGLLLQNGCAGPDVRTASEGSVGIATESTPSTRTEERRRLEPGRRREAESGGTAFARNRPQVEGAEDSGDFETDPDPGAPPARPLVTPPPRKAAPGLRAGYADDNRQFNYYLSFLKRFGGAARHIPVDVRERIRLRLVDSAGASLPDARLVIRDARGRTVEIGRTAADGQYDFFPSFFPGSGTFLARIEKDGRTQDVRLTRSGPREVNVTWAAPRGLPETLPLDIVFVMDTTGSMGEEIDSLKSTIEIIYRNLSAVRPRPRVRFGMVLYRDRQDEYVTKVIPLTERLDRFQKQLESVQAEGGGDNPEDLQTALHDGLRKIQWAENGVRLGFVVTDAPPHLYKDQSFHYVKATLEARSRAIKFHTIGTGGLNLDGEYVLRQIAQLTRGRYIFLTYGDETGDNEGGRPGSVSHHTGSNFRIDKLEQVVIRFAREELAHVSKVSVSEPVEYWGARPVGFESGQATLRKLFGEATGQLVNYSSFQIADGSPAAVLPIIADAAGDKGAARYFSEQLLLALSRSRPFRLIERERIRSVLADQASQRSGLYNEEDAARIGRLTGAKFMIAGKLTRRPGGYSVFLKLLRVKTGEILSVTEARIDDALGRETTAALPIEPHAKLHARPELVKNVKYLK